jgi:hypothetical protein
MFWVYYNKISQLVIVGILAMVIALIIAGILFPSKKAEAEPYSEQRLMTVLLDMRDAQNAQAKALTEIAKELQKIK